MIKRLYILGVLLLAIGLATPSPAQEQHTSPSAPSGVEAAPDKYIIEAQEFFRYCKKDDYLGKHFDCRCVASEFFDMRLKKGPQAKSSELVESLDKKQCLYKKQAIINQDTANIDMDTVSDKDIDEAQEFFQSCKNTPNMATYYDCECLASQYLSERQEQGPDAVYSSIFQAIRKECPNTEAAAGYMYGECQKMGTLVARHQPLDEFCECAGNTFAKLYTKSGVEPGSQGYQNLRSQALVMCTVLPGGQRLSRIKPEDID